MAIYALVDFLRSNNICCAKESGDAKAVPKPLGFDEAAVAKDDGESVKIEMRAWPKFQSAVQRGGVSGLMCSCELPKAIVRPRALQ